MLSNNLFPIAKEGVKYLSLSAILFLLALLIDCDFLATLFFFSFIFFAYLFRNPERVYPDTENSSLLSPVDGIVKNIQELRDNKFSYKIEIESSYKDVGILRAPASAKVEYVQKFNGTRVSPTSKLFNDTNENVSLIFLDKNENRFQVTHRAKQSFVPISTHLTTSQNVHQSFRYGFMGNGVTSIYLPSNFRINVTIGHHLKASESLLGYFS